MRWRLCLGLLTLLLVSGSNLLAQSDNQSPSRPMDKAVLGIAVDNRTDVARNGVMVADVMPNGPADKAGLKAGDLISKIGDQDVRDYDALIREISKHKPGDKVTLHVKHGDQSKDITVTLASEPTGGPEPARRGRMSRSNEPPRRPFGGEGFQGGPPPMLGIQMAPMSPDMKQRLGVSEDKGVVVADVMPGSPAQHAGLMRDDVLVNIAGKAVNSPEDVQNAVRQSQMGQELSLTFMHGKDRKEVKVRMEPPRMEGMMQAGGFGGPPDVQRLEQKINQLEKRIAELEQKLKQRE